MMAYSSPFDLSSSIYRPSAFDLSGYRPPSFGQQLLQAGSSGQPNYLQEAAQFSLDQGRSDFAGMPGVQQIFGQAAAAADPFAPQRGQYQNALQQMMTGNFTPNDPSYKWRFDQGQQGVERSMAAKGFLGSGNILAELQKQGQGMASQEYQNQYDRLLPLTGATTGSPGAAGNFFSQLYGARNDALSNIGGGLASMQNIQDQKKNSIGFGGSLTSSLYGGFGGGSGGGGGSTGGSSGGSNGLGGGAVPGAGGVASSPAGGGSSGGLYNYGGGGWNSFPAGGGGGGGSEGGGGRAGGYGGGPALSAEDEAMRQYIAEQKARGYVLTERGWGPPSANL